MSILGGGGGDIHHHGLLAGASAGALAVIVVPLLAVWLARHQVTEALTAAIWVIVVLIAAAGLAGILYVYRFVWHKHVQFSAAAPVRLRAEVTAIPAAEITAAPVQELPPAPVHLHLPEGMDPAQVAVLLAGLQAGKPPELGYPACSPAAQIVDCK